VTANLQTQTQGQVGHFCCDAHFFSRPILPTLKKLTPAETNSQKPLPHTIRFSLFPDSGADENPAPTDRRQTHINMRR
jgi:hypothetical protein